MESEVEEGDGEVDLLSVVVRVVGAVSAALPAAGVVVEPFSSSVIGVAAACRR